MAVIGLALLLARDAPADTTTPAQVRRLVLDREFDFLRWTLGAAGDKLTESSLNVGAYLPDPGRKQVVLDYLELVQVIQTLEARIEQAYAEPSQLDPAATTPPLRAQLNQTRAEQAVRQPLAEAVLQSQLAAVLSDLGLSLGGQPVPPVSFQTTPLPLALVVSPREVIRQDALLQINPGLAADEQTALEGEVEQALNLSALLVPLGGIGTYPTMVQETAGLNWLAEVTAHEWVHNFLSLRPLGINYFATSELRTMNETAASLAGKEIGAAVIARFYPELAPLPPAFPPAEAPSLDPVTAPEPVAFDFQVEMRETRVRADELLAKGKIQEAELYMELRRRVFVEHGYSIRRLNQAYFAFYGAYADEPGAPGADPVGPAVVGLRQRSPSLAAFLNRMSWFTSFEQLQRALKD